MNEDKIFTENPENELWRELLQYSYKTNIERYFDEKSLDKNEEVIDCISGSFLQAYEYYKSSINVNLQITPLLLYYGTTNLLYGMSSLFKGKISEIHNHGMKNELNNKNRIADAKVYFENPQSGGIHIFSNSLGYKEDLTKYGEWQLKEFFASIAEINIDYKKCYSSGCGNVLMLDVINTPEGRIDKINYNDKIYDDILGILQKVEGFKESYLTPQTGEDREGNKYFILRRKMVGEEITKISYSGQPYLQAGQIKNGKLITLPSILNMYISLFSMSSLCRYHPEIWSPFVLNDRTGERLLVEKFLYYARRMIPNLVLNTIYGKRITYVTEKYTPKDNTKLVSEHEVHELIEKEVYSQINRNNILR